MPVVGDSPDHGWHRAWAVGAARWPHVDQLDLLGAGDDMDRAVCGADQADGAECALWELPVSVSGQHDGFAEELGQLGVGRRGVNLNRRPRKSWARTWTSRPSRRMATWSAKDSASAWS